MRITNIEISSVKYRMCPKCKENAPYDIKYGFYDEGTDEEQSLFKECRLCWHKEPHKTRNTKQKIARTEKRERMNELIEELMRES